ACGGFACECRARQQAATTAPQVAHMRAGVRVPLIEPNSCDVSRNVSPELHTELPGVGVRVRRNSGGRRWAPDCARAHREGAECKVTQDPTACPVAALDSEVINRARSEASQRQRMACHLRRVAD